MIEMAIVLPLLLVLMLAVGYFGHAVISLQTLHSGSRSAARTMALESTETPDRRRNGSYDPAPEHFLALSQDFLAASVRPAQLVSRPETRLSHDYNQVLGLEGRFERPGESQHRFVYTLSETIDATSSSYNTPAPEDIKGNPPANLRSLGVGLGAVYYGGTLEYSLDELTPLSRFIFRFSNDPVI
ncbi:MAG: TadE/TadG family type IV pilus assembly protein, partial [Candidatus Sericytochromatia bacterium]